MYFRGERSGKKNTFTVLQEVGSPGPPLNTLFDRWVYVKCRIHGSGYPTPQDLSFWGVINTFYRFGFSRSPGNVNFFWGIPFIEKCILGGWVAEKLIILGKWSL